MSGTVAEFDSQYQSERAARHREKAAHFKELASVELQPRARAQLLGLAAEYDQLAEIPLIKPSAKLQRLRVL